MQNIQQEQQLPGNSLGLYPQRELSSFRASLSTGINLHYVFKEEAIAQPLLLGIDRIEQAIILIHGYSDSWRSFEEMLKLFPLDNFKGSVFALDLRGHGESSSNSSPLSMVSRMTIQHRRISFKRFRPPLFIKQHPA